MNIFELAMAMETEGRNYYLKHAESTDHPALKRILTELADDELKHYNYFKALYEGHGSKLEAADHTKIIETAKAIWEEAADTAGDYQTPEDAQDIWEHAAEVEKKSEDFYREKAAECSDENEKQILLAIADEEHRHWQVINSVVSYLSAPTRYIADAEWSNVDDL